MFYIQNKQFQADEVRFGIADCDWYSAPIPFRKLVLNVLTRCTREVNFRASPFYDLDLVLLTRVSDIVKYPYETFTDILKFIAGPENHLHSSSCISKCDEVNEEV